jgi:hypothetical protein
MRIIYPGDFIMYVYFRVFKTYLWALSIFSLTITIIVTFIVKHLLQHSDPDPKTISLVKPFFQLSYLLFVPIFFLLLVSKFKKKFIDTGGYSELNMPKVVAWFITIVFLIFLAILFTDVLINW